VDNPATICFSCVFQKYPLKSTQQIKCQTILQTILT